MAREDVTELASAFSNDLDLQEDTRREALFKTL